jgi:hypothetical protein
VSINGMDVEAAERLARMVDQYVERVEKIRQQLDRRIVSLDWWGPDADRFKAKELAEISRLSIQLARSAQLLANSCRSNLAAQRRVSSGGAV